MSSNSAGQAFNQQREAQSAADIPAERASTQDTDGYILNHVAIKVASVSTSKAFYVDFLGMKEIFTVETGRFTAHYLGSTLTTGESSRDMLSSLGSRSALLELITDQARDLTTKATGRDENTHQINVSGQRNAHGFVHLGFRVPDVAETMRRARQLGWTVLKDVGETEIAHGVLPGRSNEGQQPREWQGDFKNVLAQIGFVADPDM
ncbi:hypothetical protein BFJ70_g16128 [Fusarium oxysporum]|uniref:VOC domain-containing protein n=3 Tax=Fusarium oxysporum TaxID=5507 RepID=A0A2H3GKM9_FUSOX|nr:hypothetical protein AU210_012545 [Fusarium oxysporum f. sp. radicis-cucumerinum]RKK10312.1 hypothetical protein BFJ65_g15610 [Fusarium oxysporum f. sp. cepae]RKK81751.1 hypothetical protein BFJ71_g15502 [Fusarium oxysporum]RKK23898.1 hypothetical protein BFJ67_g16913 [Fusarium oxysporum f. sp. cepae]RKK35967.1 hypothetical protein BFJ66_g13711 [Fusarium oxysporum f. sp. cepae]